jgi:hypothetical protein
MFQTFLSICFFIINMTRELLLPSILRGVEIILNILCLIALRNKKQIF